MSPCHRRLDDGLITNLFAYNLRSELTSAHMSTNLYAYTYDPIGNRLSATENGATTLYAANELNQYTSLNPASTNPTPFTYDADGNMTQYGDFAFFWDAENRLLGVASNGIALVTNRYDYMSRRIEKGSAAGTNTFLYDGWNLIRENTKSAPLAVEIANPDFADGLAGWTYSNVEAGTCGPQTVAKFTTSGAWLEQDIGAVAGDEYLVTFRYHPSGCGGAPGYGSYPWNITVSIGDATASTNGSYAPWATWNSMSNFTFRIRPSTPALLRIAVGGMPNPVVTHVSVAHVQHTSHTYVWGLDLSGTLQGAGGVGGLLVQRHSSADTPWFSFCDANGNITDLLDEVGIPVAHYEYNCLGSIMIMAGSQTDANVFRCSSKYSDIETHLHFYGHRFYSPEMGRWTSRDPINELGFQNNIDPVPAAEAEASTLAQMNRMAVREQQMTRAWSFSTIRQAFSLERFLQRDEVSITSGWPVVSEFSDEGNDYLMAGNAFINTLDILGLSSWTVGVPAAGACALMDGPLPFADIAAICILGYCLCTECSGPPVCPPCDPPVESGAYEVHTVPPAKPHKPYKGTHTHHFKMNQSPWPTCKCFWQRDYIPVTEGNSPLPGEIPVVPAGGGKGN